MHCPLFCRCSAAARALAASSANANRATLSNVFPGMALAATFAFALALRHTYAPYELSMFESQNNNISRGIECRSVVSSQGLPALMYKRTSTQLGLLYA